MRRNFAQILKEAKVDIKKEYDRLYKLFYCKELNRGIEKYNSIYALFGAFFEHFPLRGTCISIKDFDEQYGFAFVKDPVDFNIDLLVSFMEYIYNLTLAYQGGSQCTTIGIKNFNLTFLLEQVDRVCTSIGYTQISCEGIIVFIRKSPI